MAKIIILGNLAADAEVKSTVRADKPAEFVTFRVAENEKRGDENIPTYYDVTMGKTGVFEYLKKGQKVQVIGNFRFSLGEGKDGRSYPNLQVNALSVELAGRKPE
jgi:single-stranded DNA-binding protein